MAVVMQHRLFFGGVDSSTYGVYIGGEGVFNAPKRAVDMVTVPGRNGAIAVDQGYWENIEVTYTAYIQAPDLETLAENLSDFRNAIVSKTGYQRLEDTIHSDEYRMAVYSDGLEFEPIGESTTVQFDLKFNCKPQRWLLSGMTAQSVASGSTIRNDTVYEASPRLAINGTGNVTINGYSIDLSSGTFGNIVVVDEFRTSGSKTVTLDSTKFNDSDTLTIPERTGTMQFAPSRYPTEKISSFSLTNDGGCTSKKIGTSESLGKFQMVCPQQEWSLSENHSITYTCTASISTNVGTRTIALVMQVTYTASTHRLRFLVEVTGTGALYMRTNQSMSVGDCMVNSTKPYLSGTTYIDCELGECYRFEGVKMVSLNPYVDLGNELPVLSPGTNSITYDSTITSLMVTPRWWIL